MNRVVLKLLITSFYVLLMGVLQPALAQDPATSRPGLSGSLQGGAYILQTDSQLYCHDDNSRNDDLDGPSDTYEEIEPLVSAFLRYQFENGSAIYAGNPLEIGKDLTFSAGVIQPLPSVKLDVALAWVPINDVWENPYQLGSSRDKTNMDTRGLRIKLQELAGSRWEGFYNIDRIDIDDDEIGELEDDLKRDGWTHELGVKYTLTLNHSLSLRPEISYAQGDIQGHSNSFQGVNLGLLLMYTKPPWILSGHVFGFHSQYQKTHPIFDKTRHETGYFTLAQATRLNLFGKKYLFASLIAGYGATDANINFYDSHTFLGLASVGINI